MEMNIFQDVVLICAIFAGALCSVSSFLLLIFALFSPDLEKARAAGILIIYTILLVFSKWVVLPLMFYFALLLVPFLLWTIFDLLRLDWFAKLFKGLMINVSNLGLSVVHFVFRI